jgi:predicted PhzF superfamily epimerase YddE/YHI9
VVPYWSKQLGKSQLVCRQISARGGELVCEDRGDRVILGGQAVLFMKGEVYL